MKPSCSESGGRLLFFILPRAPELHLVWGFHPGSPDPGSAWMEVKRSDRRGGRRGRNLHLQVYRDSGPLVWIVEMLSAMVTAVIINRCIKDFVLRCSFIFHCVNKCSNETLVRINEIIFIK